MSQGKAEFSGPGWVVVLCLHVSCILWSGVLKALGVMLPTLVEQFATKTWLIGWMVAIINGAINIVGPLSGPLDSLLGTRVVVMVSGILIGTSLIVASLTTSVVEMTVTLTLGVSCLSYSSVLMRAAVARCFPTNYATATGLAMSGFPVGTLLIAPMTQLLLDTYGWRAAMMLLGAMSLHLPACGALLRQRSRDSEKSNQYETLREDDDLDDSSRNNIAKEKSRLRAFKDALTAQTEHLGFSVCLKFSFWIATLLYVCIRFVSDQWLVYFVPQAEAKGFSPQEAVTFVTAAGIGNIVFKLVLGVVVDRGMLKLRPAMAAVIVMSCVSFVIVPWVTSYWMTLTNAVVFYGSCGAISSLIDIFTRELLGVDLLISAFSWMEVMTALVSLGFGFFPGWIYDQTGSYDLAFVSLGCVWALSLVALLMEQVNARWKKK
ncbi:monocarboxylate transporter 12-like [Patiria miniata]|uniref:Major facilitator superfamily (MFS) profile domain-containing protein n=1 Tax=Patiria miniata TaxID=46514 RepID=A0A913ZAC5_PATMI|nr:monocarboxylate transporter 12-like [Patiria miniata]